MGNVLQVVGKLLLTIDFLMMWHSDDVHCDVCRQALGLGLKRVYAQCSYRVSSLEAKQGVQST